ncbi:hypothetical protein RCL1_000474 [Eukaryota sp. TZLM3-RCL]
MTTTLNFDTRILDTEKVTQLELNYFNEQLSAITLFPNLSCFCLSDSGVVHDFSLLAPCRNLCSISITRCSAFDLTQFSNIEQLTSLSLYDVDVTDFPPLSTFKGLTELSLDECTQFPNLISGDISNVLDSNRITDISFLSTCIKLKSLSLDRSEVADLSPLSLLVELKNLSLTKSKVFDLWPLKNLTKLSTLDLRETLFLKENQQELTNSSEIKTLINSFEHGVFDLDFSNYKYIVCDLSLYCHCSALKSLNLSDIDVRNISEISKFPNLETLDLSNVKLGYNSYRQIVRVNDISFLSTCIKLKSLSLDRSEVADLSPLSLLSNTLRSLSLNNSLFPNLCQLSNFKQLEFLSLNNNNITDICPLSSLQNLTNLSLYNTKVSDLSSLQYLSKLSFLDVRKTLLSHEYHRRVSGLSCVQEFLNSFTVDRVDFSITSRKRTCSSELSLKKSR